METHGSKLTSERISVLHAQRIFPAERLLQILHDSGFILYDEEGAAAAAIGLFQENEPGHITLSFLSRQASVAMEYTIGERDSRGTAEWTLDRFTRKDGVPHVVELVLDEKCAHFYYEFQPHQTLRLFCAPSHLAELEVAAVVRRVVAPASHTSSHI